MVLLPPVITIVLTVWLNRFGITGKPRRIETIEKAFLVTQEIHEDQRPSPEIKAMLIHQKQRI